LAVEDDDRMLRRPAEAVNAIARVDGDRRDGNRPAGGKLLPVVVDFVGVLAVPDDRAHACPLLCSELLALVTVSVLLPVDPFHLQRVEPAVETVARPQLLVSSDLRDAALVHDDDAIGVAPPREAIRAGQQPA